MVNPLLSINFWAYRSISMMPQLMVKKVPMKDNMFLMMSAIVHKGNFFIHTNGLIRLFFLIFFTTSPCNSKKSPYLCSANKF